MSEQSNQSTTEVLPSRKTPPQNRGVNLSAIENALVTGDLSRLTEEQRISYVKNVCETVGLNPMTKPFEYITLNGKLVLYATKACAEQLRSRRDVSVTIKSRETVGDCYVVTASAETADGRVDESIGAVSIGGLKGDQLCNAIMKAETKAKRRVTLSICGLGMLDESELDTIRPHVSNPKPAPREVKQPAPAPIAAPKAKETVVEPEAPAPVADDLPVDVSAPSEFAVVLISGPHKGRFISDLTLEEATTYFAEINAKLEAINKPASTLFGPSKTIYFTLEKYLKEKTK